MTINLLDMRQCNGVWRAIVEVHKCFALPTLEHWLSNAGALWYRESDGECIYSGKRYVALRNEWLHQRDVAAVRDMLERWCA